MRQRGFTLVELSVVIVLLAMFAAAMVPRVSTILSSQERRGYRVSVLRLANQAREEAVQRRATVTLSTESGSFRISVSDEVQENVVETVQPVDGVEASHFVRAGQEVGETEWALAFYADGTCDGGGFQFDQGSDSQTVQIRKRDGKVSVFEGAMDSVEDPDTEWEAGGYVQTEG